MGDIRYSDAQVATFLQALDVDPDTPGLIPAVRQLMERTAAIDDDFRDMLKRAFDSEVTK